MYENIGGRIKSLAKAICVIEILACIFGGLAVYSIDDSLIWLSIIIVLLGSLLSYLSSFFLYGFGQLVENTDIIAKRVREENKKEAYVTPTNNPNQPKEINFYCPKCGGLLTYTKDEMINRKYLECYHCGHVFNVLDVLKKK